MGRARFVGTGRNGAEGILAHLPIAPSVHCGFTLEKNNILGLNCSLRQNIGNIAPLQIVV
jgi:hypothetical protein